MRVHEVMTRWPVCVGPDTPTSQAWRLLESHELSLMPVVDGDGRIVGTVSADDLMPGPGAAARGLLPSQRSVRPQCVAEVMTRALVTIGGAADLGEAVELMSATGCSTIPVLDGRGRPVGLLDRRVTEAAALLEPRL